MKKGMSVLLVGIAVMLTCSGIATAGLMDTLGLGSKATALGGAFCAYADDPFAIYYNPAGLTQIDRFTVSNGAHLAYPSIKVNNFHVEGGKIKTDMSQTPNPLNNNTINSLGDISNKERIVPAPHFATAYPLNNKLVAGFAVYAPFGASAYWPETENSGRYNSTFGSFTRIAATPTLSYMLSDRLSVGFGISLGVTEVKSERIFYVPDEIINYLKGRIGSGLGHSTEQKMQAAIDANGSKVVAELLDTFNYSYNLGIMYHLNDKITLGMTYRSRADVKVSGTVEIEGLPESYGQSAVGEPIMSKVDAETEVDHPPQFQFGIRCQPSEEFSIEIDYVWTKWSIIDGYAIQLNPSLLNSRSEEAFRRDWEDTNQIRFGFEWVSDEFVTVRAGYYFDPSPVPDDTFDFASSDINKMVYSLGLGFNFDNFTIDTVFQFITSEARKSTDNENDPFSASYEFLYDKQLGVEAFDQSVNYEASMQVWTLGATLNYTF